MGNNVKMIKLLILLGSVIFCISQTIKETNKYMPNYNNPLQKDIINITEDEFVYNTINSSSIINYNFLILNDTEEIFFDYQSEFGCLDINIVKEEINNSLTPDFQFCSNGTNNIFSIKKNEILKIINNTENNSLSDINLNIEVGYSPLEKNYDFIFNFSLKISLRKPDINIFKINSDHRVLCKTEKITDNNNYRCIFMAVNHGENDENIIIYSKSINDINKLNIYANFINKSEYDNYNIDYLSNNIPDETSKYTNYNKDKDFIIIPKIEKDSYIYISIESSIETTIELMNKKINNTDNSFLKPDEIRFYSINNTKITIDLNITNETYHKNISLTLVTLNGKGNINLYYNYQRQYITDTIDNKIEIKFDLFFKLYFQEIKLIINSIDDDEDHELGFVFYIYYNPFSNSSERNTVNNLNELTYGKSSKLLKCYSDDPLIFYEKIEDINALLNMNFQFYNLENKDQITDFTIEISIISKIELYSLKLNYEDIKKCKIVAKGKFDPVLAASNIYLNLTNITVINPSEEKYFLIHIKYNGNSGHIPINLEIGSTISQVNSLIYSSERIYHYGKLNDEEKIVYRLKGNKKYHLMRLEFGYNNKNISWTVKRTNDNINYIKNDTDLSFVTEKWTNGRELLTMYIERGEDIYLTIFPNKKITNIKLSNFAFKYINSAKNGDFKNYLIKSDSLDYNKKKHLVSIKKLENIPETSSVNYFVKVISDSDYNKDEILKTISITESECKALNEVNKNNKDKIVFNITNLIEENIYYYINAYSIVNDNDDYEYVSYSNIKIRYVTRQIKEASIGLIIASLSLAGLTFIILVTRCFWYCCCKSRRSRYNYYDYNYHDNLLY